MEAISNSTRIGGVIESISEIRKDEVTCNSNSKTNIEYIFLQCKTVKLLSFVF